MSKILAADIGGTNMRMAVVSQSAVGAVIEHEYRAHVALSEYRAPSAAAAETYVIQVISEAMRPILQQHAITAVGVGFPGFFDADGETLLASPNLPQLKHVRLASRLSDQLSCVVRMQNDALCAALGEWRDGAGKGQTDLLHVTLGTGVGGGLILADSPFVGQHGMAMELGHVRTACGELARMCGCGGSGCVETYASAQGVLKSYQLACGDEHGSSVTAPAQVAELAKDGDAAALHAFEQAGCHLGKALAHVVTLLDLRTITVSGGLMGAWDLLHPPLMASLNEHVIPMLQGQVVVLPTLLSDQAGLLGAAELVRMELVRRT